MFFFSIYIGDIISFAITDEQNQGRLNFILTLIISQIGIDNVRKMVDKLFYFLLYTSLEGFLIR